MMCYRKLVVYITSAVVCTTDNSLYKENLLPTMTIELIHVRLGEILVMVDKEANKSSHVLM